MGRPIETEITPLARLKYSSPLAHFAVSSLELQTALPNNSEHKSLPERMELRGDSFFTNVLSSVPSEHRESIRREIVALRSDIHTVGLSVEEQVALKAFANSVGKSFGLTREPLWRRITRQVVQKVDPVKEVKPELAPIRLEQSAVAQAEKVLADIQMRRESLVDVK